MNYFEYLERITKNQQKRIIKYITECIKDKNNQIWPHCPKCKSTRLWYLCLEINDRIVSHLVMCDKCNHLFKETYTQKGSVNHKHRLIQELSQEELKQCIECVEEDWKSPYVEGKLLVTKVTKKSIELSKKIPFECNEI